MFPEFSGQIGQVRGKLVHWPLQRPFKALVTIKIPGLQTLFKLIVPCRHVP